jgi:cell division protein FtsB
MSEIDLIPVAYRTRRWQTRWMKYTVTLVFSLAGLIILGLLALTIATTNARVRVEALKVRQMVTAQQRADIERLGAEKTELEQQFRLLSGLRSGAAAGDMFMTIDRALTSNDVWFRNWQFQRAGVTVGEEVRTVHTGYFVVVPDGAGQQASDDLRVQTHMAIRGQARDHSALSGFVRRLFVQPEIDDIRIRRTSLAHGDRADTVDFELAVVLNTEVRVE